MPNTPVCSANIKPNNFSYQTDVIETICVFCRVLEMYSMKGDIYLDLDCVQSQTSFYITGNYQLFPRNLFLKTDST